MAAVFDTVFKIGALFTGQAAITQAQNAVGVLEQKGLLANVSFKKLIGTVTGIAAGWFTVDKLTGFIGSSIDAARKAKNAYQGMYDSLGKFPGLQKLGAQAIKQQSDKVQGLAKDMEKLGGLASETLMTAFQNLSDKGFAPAKIRDVSSAFQDVIVRVKGVKASAEDAAEVASRWADAVKGGGKEGADALIAMGIITEEQRGKFESIQGAANRYNFVLGEMKKKTGDTAEAMKSMDGLQVRMQNQWKNLKVTIGTPFAQAQDALTGGMDKIKAILLTSATKVADDAVPALSNAMGKVQAALATTTANIATTITPTVTKVTEALTDFVVKHPQFAAAVAVTTTAVGGLAAVSPIAQKVNSFAGAVKEVHGAFKLVTSINPAAIIGLMTNPAVWVVVGIAAVAAAIYLLVTHWKEVKAACIAAWDAVKAAWSTASEWVNTHIIEPIVNLFGGFVGKIKVGDLWGAFLEWINISQKINSAILQVVVDLFGGLIPRIVPVIGDLGNAFLSWSANIVNWFNEHIINPIVEVFKKLPGMIGDALKGIADIILKAITGVGAQGVAGAVGFAGQMAGSVVSGVKSFLHIGGQPGAQQASTAAGTISGVSGGPIQITHYGYEKKGDKDWDSNSARGIGAYNNQLVAGYDAALNRSAAGILGVDYTRDLGKTFGYQGRTFRYGDRTAEWLPNPRLDIYDPTGTLVKAALGGIMAKPGLAMLAERVPEMAIPLERTGRSKNLLSAAAAMISPGFGRAMGGETHHVSVAPVINISGGGQMDAQQIGREVERAMRDPVRTLLDQLKKAKQYESRLAYV